MTKLFSVKNTGLSGNILKFLITFDFCKKHSMELVFPCSDEEKKILLRFDHVDLNVVSFPNYVCSQKHIFNEKSRIKYGDSYEQFYKEFLKKWYSFSIHGELVYSFGNVSNVKIEDGDRTIFLDYNDGVEGYRKSLSNIHESFKFKPIIHKNYIYRKPNESIASFNLKTSISEQFSEEKSYWISTITNFLKFHPRKTPFFVSGNNEMKFALCEHFGIPFLETETEIKVSLREDGVLSRGKSEAVMVDLQNCVNTEFVSLERLIREFSVDGIRPVSQIFRIGKAEKFDLLVDFFKRHDVLSGS